MGRCLAIGLVFFLAGCGRGPAKSPHPATRSAARPHRRYPALSKALASGNRKEQIHAAQALAELGPEGASAVPALLPVLETPDDEVRREAEKALRAIGAAAIPSLVGGLTASDWRARAPAVKALALLGRPAVRAVIPLLEKPRLRMGALEVLTETDVPRTFDPSRLLPLLKDPSVEVRVRVTKLAVRIAEKRWKAALPVIRAALYDNSFAVVDPAVRAIGSHPRTRGIGCDLAAAVDHDPLGAGQLLEAIVKKPEPAVLSVLARSLESGRGGAATLHELAHYARRRKEYLPLIVAALSRDDFDLRVAAVQALRAYGSRATLAIPALRKCVTFKAPAGRVFHGDPSDLRDTAAEILHELHSPIPLAALPMLLGDAPRADYIPGMLKRAGPHRAVQALSAALFEAWSSPPAEKALLDLLGGYGPAAAPAAENLAQLLSGKCSCPRRVMQVLKKIGAPAVPPLEQELNYAQGVHRLDVLDVLRALEQDRGRFEKEVLAALASERFLVRARAIEIVKEWGPEFKAAIPELARLLDRKNPALAEKILTALGATGPAALPALRTYLASSPPKKLADETKHLIQKLKTPARK